MSGPDDSRPWIEKADEDMLVIQRVLAGTIQLRYVERSHYWYIHEGEQPCCAKVGGRR